MNSQEDAADLMEQIRHQADEAVLNHNGTGGAADAPAADEDWPPLPTGGLPAPPSAPAFAPFDFSDPVPLAEAATLVPRAKEKLAVNPGIPGVLRPLFRNQGGFNGILLQTCGRLVEASQHLQRENQDLRTRLDAVVDHLAEQNLWLAGLAQAQTESQQWSRSIQGRFQQQFALVEERCHRAEIRLDRAEGLLDGARATADEQGGALARLETQFEQQQTWIQDMQAFADEQTVPSPELENADDQTPKDTVILTASQRLERHEEQIRGLFERSDEHAAHLGEHAAHLQTADARMDQMGGQVNRLQTESDEQHRYIGTVHGHLDRLGEHLGRVEEGAIRSRENLSGIQAHTDRLGTHLHNLQAASDQQNGYMEALDRRTGDAAELCNRARQELATAVARHDLLEASTRRLAERQINDFSFLRSQLTFQQRLLGEWLGTQPRANVPASAPALGGAEGTEQVQEVSAAGSDGASLAIRNQSSVEERLAGQEMDALYLAFEDTMRGNRETIKERVRFYLPYLRKNQLGSQSGPVLDLGCGRGEWLEVLREEGLHAAGVDLNACMIDQCRERGLNAALGNALDYLGSQADASCGVVTAFHLIEHLPFGILVKFFTECLRVLQPGGLAIFETPNPNNVLVGACTFYSDYTHQRPLPPDSTRFLVEHLGFAQSEIVALNPRNRRDMVPGDGTNEALILRFNELFYGPQDYAIVARATTALPAT